jgi:glutamate-1-semialdehyde 2,1-aminomutase
MRVGLATLHKMDRLDGWRSLNDRTTKFCRELTDALKDAHAPIDVVAHASIFWPRVQSPEPVRRVDRIPERQRVWYAAFFHAALRRGVYLPPAAFEVCFLSMAHDADALRTAIDALAEAAKEAEG